MKKVLMSIHPQWCEKIFNGSKTIEVRKTAPKIDTPFEVLVYETKKQFVKSVRGAHTKYGYGRGQVIGSFVCDGISHIHTLGFDSEMSRQTCLTFGELSRYLGGVNGVFCALHITEPKLFDKPKELSEFWAYNAKLHKLFANDEDFCCHNGTNEYGELINECSLFSTDIKRCYSCWEEWSGWCHRITRAPRSFVFVEDV